MVHLKYIIIDDIKNSENCVYSRVKFRRESRINKKKKKVFPINFYTKFEISGVPITPLVSVPSYIQLSSLNT